MRTEKYETDVVVIGAGVVGLACARELARQGREVVILEANRTIGMETSSRNSEVIHGGLYYPSGSLKAELCVTGRALLYEFCGEFGVAHRRCGKLIVATGQAQHEKLDALAQQAERNGVMDIQRLSRDQARALEPALECTAALLSPSTGIIDSHALIQALLGDAEAHGAQLAVNTSASAGRAFAGGLEIETGGEVPTVLAATTVINSAGLHAVDAANRIEGFPREHLPRAYLARGNYFQLSGRAPFSRLVYPLPEPGGLGVHLTLDLAGQARFGPDVEWVDSIDYHVDPVRADGFYAEIRKYWPALRDGALSPAYAGIRPKISGPDEAAADFVIQGPSDHGVAGLVNLFGIESPGLTASLAIAQAVARILR
ncbi:MAG: NAD(P)/FAD-dependent oxidoreductase [Sterolibacteriaceae bacterium]|nr:NAD(P)/FAD-dependent oxidoreductase [Sterolibacteriaceae bacterium]MBK9085097.1 NAD(P)/FAD-dependent oxidoreductase [Sterolibacteriaceae bacterium]